MTDGGSFRELDPATLAGRQRYELMTSLVVPRPIGWISTWGTEAPNLAPFSYFGAISVRPMLVAVSIGDRRDGPKDSLVNIRARDAFCVNVVSEALIEAMNATSAEVPPEVDEFELAGLEAVRSVRVDAPYVASAPAVFECRVRRMVDLGDVPNTLVIGEVVGILLSDDLAFLPESYAVDPDSFLPVGRLSGSSYSLHGRVRSIPRPR